MILLFIWSCLGNSNAQEVWPLEKCIKHAQEQNLSIKRSQEQLKLSRVDISSSKSAVYPNLNYSTSAGYQWGRTIDYATNTYVNQSSNYNSHQLSSSVSLYEGGSIRNNIKLSNYNFLAAEADMKQTMEDISLSVAATYLTILLNIEGIEIAKKRLEVSQKQMDVTVKLINAGNLPRNEKLNLDAQVAREEENLFAQQNSLELAYLDLKNLLNLDPEYNMTVEMPAIDQILVDNKLITEVNDLYKEASQRNPGLAASQFRMQGVQFSRKIAGSSGLPSLTLFANISSNYSSSFVDFLHPNPDGTFPSKPYFDQFNDNLGEAVGISLRVPIYNNGLARYAIQRAEINIRSAEIANDQVKQQFKSTIFRSVADYKAARLRVEAAQREFEAATGAYNNTQKKFDAGSANSLDLITAKNNANTAQDNLLTARYTFVFRAKVLEYYMGKQIQLN